jgi:alpha-beta hydrolase superfamily lysophospholipase
MSTLTENAVDAVRWDPPAAVRGTIVVVPGRGERPEHYERFGRRISADGYAVEILPHLASGGDELAHAWDALALAGRLGDAPRVLIATDVSTAAAVQALSPATIDANALVLAGTTLEVADAPTDVDEALAARTACPLHRGLLAADQTTVTSLANTTPAVGQWRAALDGAAIEGGEAWQVAVPTLVLHGEADQLAPWDRVRDAVGHWPGVELVTVRGGVHDVLNDANHRSVAGVIVQFLEQLRAGGQILNHGGRPA